MRNGLSGLARPSLVLVSSFAVLSLSGCGGAGAGAGAGSSGPVPVTSAGSGQPMPTASATPIPTPSPTATATPLPTPSPTPSPTAPPTTTLHGVVAEGDSISYFWGGSYTGIYAAAHPSIEFAGLAVSGSGIVSMTGRLPAALAKNPAVVTFMIGTNDLGTENWWSDVRTYAAKIRATGAKVMVGTLLNRCLDTKTYPQFAASNAAFIRDRAVANASIRAAAAVGEFDGVADFAADPLIGTDEACLDKSLFYDGTHPADIGQLRMAAIYTAALDRLKP